MTRPITLFTGQWADLPFEEVARLAGQWGFDGLEIACWGDHLDPWRAVEDDAYLQSRLDILDEYGLEVHAIANHLGGQAVCDDPIDERHHAILPARVWGDGEPEGVRRRAAEAMAMTAPRELVDVWVLSPLSVLPSHQRRGVGGSLVRAALAEVGRLNLPLVFLEGDPGYYPQHGFIPGATRGFTPPSVRIPPVAFQVATLPAYEPWMSGALVYSDVFWRLDCVGLRG